MASTIKELINLTWKYRNHANCKQIKNQNKSLYFLKMQFHRWKQHEAWVNLTISIPTSIHSQTIMSTLCRCWLFVSKILWNIRFICLRLRPLTQKLRNRKKCVLNPHHISSFTWTNSQPLTRLPWTNVKLHYAAAVCLASCVDANRKCCLRDWRTSSATSNYGPAKHEHEVKV